jgi:hypothetical protein
MTVVPGHIDRRLDMNFQTANVIEVPSARRRFSSRTGSSS